ncbi:ABC-type transport system, involved in lipoprotein release, permease component [Mycolicibacterium chubuense NBB4]|uniref:ABC-type transport system, involved in lipoprotein release, permease component n=1 Tax=Mycolicibacterium chubuense (strain NBB4) TaxID=710421 RepID=I4BD29_MYCCN|nr:FtsX-like permease family protein [Mycolicibacterium chubuense]AFM15186.1 ABC-type transport system, involved in lipoprotein release, permease component [Mycolicibacterium chubuense NBB4]
MPFAAYSRLRTLTARELRTHWVRALASAAVIAVSATLLVAVLGVSGSITGSIDRLSASIGGDADLEVSGITAEGFDQALFDRVSQVHNVTAAVPLTRTATTAGDQRILVLGIGANAAALHSDLQTAIQDQLRGPPPDRPVTNGVVVGSGVGVDRGDHFTIGSAPVTAGAVVGGPAAQRLNEARFVMAPLELAQRISGKEHRLDSILVFTDKGADVDRVRADIATAIGGRAVVAAPSFRAAQASSSFAILQAMTLLAASVSLVVAAFLSYNAMSIAIAQRRPAIATLRALGGRRRTIMADMLAEAALLGLAGGVLGSLAGIVIGHFAIDALPPTMVQSLQAHIEYVLAPYVVPLTIVACLAASVTASALAARQVYSVSPVEALAPAASAPPANGSRLRRMRVVAAVVGAALVLATILIVTADLGRGVVASIAVAFIGAAALCFAASGAITRAAAAVTRVFGGPGALGAANMQRAPQRMWVALMTVVTAVVTTVAVTGATADAVDSTVASFSSVAHTDLWVSSAAPSDYSSTLLPPDTETAVAAVPGVERVVPDQMEFASINGTRVMLLGVAPGSHRDIYTALPQAQRAELAAGRGIALSRDLGHALHLSEGDDLTLPTPTGQRRVHVVALIPYFSGMTGTIAMDLDTMRTWFDRPGASDLEVTVARGADVHAVQAAIRAAVAPGTFVYTGAEALRGVRSALDPVTAIITVIGWIVVAVAAITLLNVLMLSVLDRRREIGALRAIGASRRFTLAAVLSEATGVGVVGGAVGLVLGIAIQYLTSLALTNVLSIDVAWHPSPEVLGVGVAAVVVCLLGAVPPAVRATRMDIIEAVSVD